MKAWAEFKGWQVFELTRGEVHIPLFNIEGEHPRAHSTVGPETLDTEHIPVPEYPSFEEWTQQQAA